MKINEDYIEDIDNGDLISDDNSVIKDECLQPDVYQYMLEIGIDGGNIPDELFEKL